MVGPFFDAKGSTLVITEARVCIEVPEEACGPPAPPVALMTG
jgi:hypothetical protein